MAIRVIVFDLFDTLVDLLHENLPMEQHNGVPLPATARTLHAAVAERSEVDFETFVQALIAGAKALRDSHFAKDREVPTRLRFEDTVERLGLADDELPDVLTELHMGALRAQVRIPEHHLAVLDALRERVRIGLCSNFSHSDTALGILDEADFRTRLDAIVVSDAFGLRKPRREIFEAVLGELGARNDEVLHVGDSLRADVGGAAPLGIRTAWITRRIREPARRLAEHEGPQPDHTIADLAELPALLDVLG